MIKTLIFDFGDVFINLDKEGAMQNILDLLHIESLAPDMVTVNLKYEKGLISTKDFLGFYLLRFPTLKEQDVLRAWNYILKDFPPYRLDFIKQLSESNQYQLILLSNTNSLHIQWIKDHITFYEEFKSCFDRFYLSHEINMRKPDAEIFKYICSDLNLVPNECLFIDDTTENTDSASELGFNTWNIDEKNEDVVDLFSIKADLF